MATMAARRRKSARISIRRRLTCVCPDTQKLTDGEIFYIIHNGIRLTGMPAWGTEEKDDDSWKLVVFIRNLPYLTPAEEREMETLNRKALERSRRSKKKSNS